MASILAINTLTPILNACVNRDQTGEAKTCLIGNTTRGRISSQCQKYYWRNSELFAAIDELVLSSSVGSQHFRTRQAFNRLVAEALKKENLPNADLIEQYTATMQLLVDKGRNYKEAFNDYKESKKSPKATKKTPKTDEEAATVIEESKDVVLSHKQLISIAVAEIEEIKATIRKALIAKDPFLLKNIDLKTLRYELPPSIALAGKFNTGKELSTVNGALSVSHAFSVHTHVSSIDSYSANDDLSKYEGHESSGAGYLDHSSITSNLYYGFQNIDLNVYCQLRFGQNLKDCCQDPHQKARVVNELSMILEVMFQVSPQGKRSSTAPAAKSSFALLELSSSPQTSDQAFLLPIKNDSSLWSNTYNRLIDFVRDTDEIYNNKKGLSRAYFGLHMNADQRQAFEQDLGCTKVGIGSLSAWLEAAIDKINAV